MSSAMNTCLGALRESRRSDTIRRQRPTPRDAPLGGAAAEPRHMTTRYKVTSDRDSSLGAGIRAF